MAVQTALVVDSIGCGDALGIFCYDEFMQIDRRLNDIDDCLYRVAIRVLVVQNDKVLLVKEASDSWWALPGGGVDHGETIEKTLSREVEEELGVPAKEISSDFQIVYYNIGNVVNGIPRMNLFFKVLVPEALLKETDHVAERQRFTKEEFLKLDMHPSYNKVELVDVIFDD
jgi:8-oxo-dGTP diphosphatase